MKADKFVSSIRYTHNNAESEEGMFRQVFTGLKAIEISSKKNNGFFVANFIKFEEKKRVIIGKIRTSDKTTL